MIGYQSCHVLQDLSLIGHCVVVVQFNTEGKYNLSVFRIKTAAAFHKLIIKRELYNRDENASEKQMVILKLN